MITYKLFISLVETKVASITTQQRAVLSQTPFVPSIVFFCVFVILQKMHNIWIRLNAVIFFALTVLLILATMAAIR